MMLCEPSVKKQLSHERPDPLCAGAAGFQLINVNAVPLALGGWSTSTQLASRKALTATLTRHYRDEFIKEAHKVRVRVRARMRVMVGISTRVR